MATPIRLPDLGTTVEECRLVAWRVREGEAVMLGEPLADIETDKAIMELESVAAGVVLKLLAAEDTPIQVGEVLAYVGAEGEEVPHESELPAAPAAAPEAPAQAAAAPPVKVAPVVRNLAAQLGVDLAQVPGTGEGGMVTREDVRQAAQRASASPAPAAASSPGQAAVARAVSRSWAEKPHIYFTVAVDMTAAQQLRERRAAEGRRVSYDALLLQALARVLPEFPALRSVWRDGQPVPLQGIHLALAVSREEDLFLPVIRDVDRLSLAEVQREIEVVVAAVRARQLPASRLTGGCLALSNLGRYPIESFQPIIFPEHSAILAVGAAQPTPVVVQGEVVVRPMLRMTLAVDHRVVNGRTAAAFLSAVKERLESGKLE